MLAQSITGWAIPDVGCKIAHYASFSGILLRRVYIAYFI